MSVPFGAAPALPPMVAGVRAFLLGRGRVTAVVDQRVVTRTPADAGPVHLVVQLPGNTPVRARSGIYRLLVQVEGRAAAAGPEGEDPETMAWQACAAATAELAQARNVEFRGAYWTAAIDDAEGPLQLPADTTRSVAIHRVATRFEAITHAQLLAE